MKIIGITGGVGSGKSEILNILKNDYQAKVIQSDHVAHELMVPGAKSYDAIVQAFGNEILNEDQTINRPILGEIVFHDETKPGTRTGNAFNRRSSRTFGKCRRGLL